MCGGDGQYGMFEVSASKWLSLGARAPKNATRNGHVKCLVYLNEHGCEWDEDTTLGAAEGGHWVCLCYSTRCVDGADFTKKMICWRLPLPLTTMNVYDTCVTGSTCFQVRAFGQLEVLDRQEVSERILLCV